MTGMHRVLVIVAGMLGLAASGIDAARDRISALELAERIMTRDATLRILDLRSRAEYDEFHIPGAMHTSLAELWKASMPREATVVFYSEGGLHSAPVWALMRLRGYRNVVFLREGVYEWISRVHEPRLAVDSTPAEKAEFAHAAELSRFFGGLALSGVPRSEVPIGYWSGATAAEKPSVRDGIAKIRRRGC